MLILRATFVFALLAIVFFAVGRSSAQSLPGARSNAATGSGITVFGKGVASAEPDRARVSIAIYGAVGAPGQNGLGAAPVPLDDAANAVRDALRSSGITDAHEVLPIGNVSTRNVNPQLVFTVAKPTRERLEAIARQVVAAVPEKYAAALSNTQVTLTLGADDCTADEARAERAAFADARARAMRLASAAGVRLGPVTSINDTFASLPPGCGTKPDTVETSGFNFAPQNQNAYGPLVLSITVNLNITFGISP